MVFIGDLDNNVYAFDARTGAPAWKFTTGNSVWGSPTVANRIVYITSYDGNMYALDAATGLQLWVHAVGLFLSGTPAVAGGVAYIPSGTSDASLYAVDAKTGAPRWSFYAQTSMGTSSPAVANGVVYAGLDDGSLYALDAGTGALHWKSGFIGTLMMGVAVENNLAYVGARDSNDNASLYCINASSGAQVWKVLTGGSGALYSSPAVANGVVYVLGGNGLQAFDASTGAMLWEDSSVEPTGSSPAVVNGVLYSNGSGPYAYHLPSQQ
jgi:outer membrane protein assembly factor BamB